jgi:hypothetical protein
VLAVAARQAARAPTGAPTSNDGPAALLLLQFRPCLTLGCASRSQIPLSLSKNELTRFPVRCVLESVGLFCAGRPLNRVCTFLYAMQLSDELVLLRDKEIELKQLLADMRVPRDVLVRLQLVAG